MFYATLSLEQGERAMVEGETTRTTARTTARTTTTTTPTKKQKQQQQQQQQQQKQLQGVPKKRNDNLFSILDPFLTVFWPSDDPTTLQTFFQVLIIIKINQKGF